jgi:putative component of toxin-antitoxin plasmid stabilization module
VAKLAVIAAPGRAMRRTSIPRDEARIWRHERPDFRRKRLIESVKRVQRGRVGDCGPVPRGE